MITLDLKASYSLAKSLHTSQAAACPGFRNMRRLGVFPTPPVENGMLESIAALPPSILHYAGASPFSVQWVDESGICERKMSATSTKSKMSLHGQGSISRHRSIGMDELH